MTYGALGVAMAARMEASAYARLLVECGGDLAVAAWLLARSRNVDAGFATPTPTPTGLRAAAVAIAGSVGRIAPPTEVLVADARAAGRDVIG